MLLLSYCRDQPRSLTDPCGRSSSALPDSSRVYGAAALNGTSHGSVLPARDSYTNTAAPCARASVSRAVEYRVGGVQSARSRGSRVNWLSQSARNAHDGRCVSVLWSSHGSNDL
jgi:hypothetical protein